MRPLTRNRWFFLAAAALCVASTISPAAAQDWRGSGRADGVVLSAVTGEPIADAQVRMYYSSDESAGPGEPAMTNDKGRWVQAGLRPGEWRVLVDADGYIGTSQPMTVFAVGKSETLKTEMNEVPAEVKEAQKMERLNELVSQGNSLALEGKFSEAREAFQAVLDEVAEEFKPLVLAGVAGTWAQEGEVDKAIATLEESLAIDPNHPESLKRMISILAAEGRDAEAAEYRERLGESAVTLDAATQINLGIGRYNEGDLEAALVEFQAVLAREPDNIDALFYSGLVHLNQGSNAEALSAFERVSELDPEGEKATEAAPFLEFLRSEAGGAAE